MIKALFLDRDGVINKEKNYLYKVKDFEFIDGVFETCRYFLSLDYHIIIITNQSGIARGMYTENDYRVLTKWMIERFKSEHIMIAGVFHCPHHPRFSSPCDCRKPAPGLLLKASLELGIDFSKSILVGDKECDMQAAKAAGIPLRIKVKSGHKFDEMMDTLATSIIDSIASLSDVKIKV